MMNFWRAFFGLGGATGGRTVVGKADSFEAKEAPYIQESIKRLSALQELHSRYKSTPYAPKIKEVYNKTKRIHSYLVGRKRIHELELFHLQHTDHFLNTFTVIMDVHQQHPEEEPVLPPPPAPRPANVPPPKVDVIGKTWVIGPFRRDTKEVKTARMLNREANQRAFAETAEAKAEVPKLVEPQISINTYSKIVYLREDVSDGLTTNEIGFTSTQEEKETFVTYISSRLGLHNITYAGNAMVYIPAHGASHPAEMVPVIHWNGFPYALSLEDFRLFPVRTYRKRG